MPAPVSTAVKVDTVSASIGKLASEWTMLEALMGGTPAMRAAGDGMLPRWPNEEERSWKARCQTATLFPAFRRTISVMAGKPFAKQATLSEDAPAEVQAWAKDIDRTGVNLHTFASEMLAEALAFGLCGILVEAPKPIATGGAIPTVAEQKAAGVRPYWVRVNHAQIVGFRTEVVNGATILTQLRIKEFATEADGDFGDKQVSRVRVLSPGAWAVYEKQVEAGSTEEKWVLIDEGRSGLSYIPFVPLYGSRQAYMDGISPLRDLAYLNVKHWQSQSDQDTILHVARVPILAVIGGGDGVAMTIGAGTAVKLPITADIKWVEHTGKAIEAGAASLTDLEDQMIQAGAELLVKKAGTRTATESANDAEANKSDLQRIVEGFEGSLDAALEMLADYASLPTGGQVTLYKDFGAATLSDASAQLILLMEQAGVITTETALKEFQRRGTLSADIDPAVETKAAQAQADAAGAKALKAALALKPMKTPNTAPEDSANPPGV
jgi:hypothetical protein